MTTPRPKGWRIGLPLTPQATPPGWAVGLRFAEQSIPDADQLTPSAARCPLLSGAGLFQPFQRLCTKGKYMDAIWRPHRCSVAPTAKQG